MPIELPGRRFNIGQTNTPISSFYGRMSNIGRTNTPILFPQNTRRGGIPGPSNYTPQQAYNASIPQTGEDYDRLMKSFGEFGKGGGSRELMDMYRQMYQGAGYQPISYAGGSYQPSTEPYAPITYDTVSPELTEYKQSQDVVDAIKKMRELAETGGYSEGDVANLRARGISPIRSVYANAMRDLNRRGALSGGYNPGAGAALSRMAREQSEQIGGATTDVNARLAQMIAAGKQGAAPQLADLVAREGAAERDVATRNAEAKMRAAELNAANRLKVEEANRAARERLEEGKRESYESERGRVSETNRLNAEMQDRAIQNRMKALEGMRGITESDRQAQLDALKGMLSIYGTTPALAELFGRQAMGREELEERKSERKQRGRLGLIAAAAGRGV